MLQRCIDRHHGTNMVCLLYTSQPPAAFDFPYKTKDGQFKTLKNITPLEFFALAQMDVEEYMTIIHHPVPHCPYGKTYTCLLYTSRCV